MLLWTLYAQVYDVINKNVPYLKMQDEAIEELKLKEGLNVLDAGCGTGNLVNKILNQFKNIKITAIDSSREMLDRANKKLANRGAEIKYSNLEKRLELSGNSFDRVVMINSLYTLKNQEGIVNDIYRILKPEGRLVIANPDDKYSFSAIFKAQKETLGIWRFIGKLLLNLPSLVIVIFVNVFYINKNNFLFLNKGQLEELLTKAGFKIVGIKRTYANQDLLITAVK